MRVSRSIIETIREVRDNPFLQYQIGKKQSLVNNRDILLARGGATVLANLILLVNNQMEN